MQVGQTEVGREAIMVLTVDKKLNSNINHVLTIIDGLEEAQLVELTIVDSFEPGATGDG
jgi:D-3-phosphoglycerate dehydrogenase